MCNIAAYTGSRDAAPILVKMMKLEEGMSGGYYTGIATLAGPGSEPAGPAGSRPRKSQEEPASESRLLLRKCTGDLDTLLSRTDAASLPGTAGLIHSRSDSGGGDEWAHPFADGFHEEPRFAYVANGRAGCCVNRMEKTREIVQDLLDAGCVMSSRVRGFSGAYTDLPDGSSVHMSDVMCQLICRNVLSGLTVETAMEQAFCEAPSEVVGLVLDRKQPDRIFFARLNYPMYAAFSGHGAYLSSTPLAFPEDAEKVIPIPACSCGSLSAKGLSVRPFQKAPVRVAEETAETVKACYDAVLGSLASGEKCFRELSNLVKPLFPAADCCPSYQVVHRILWELRKESRLTLRTVSVPGAAEGLTAPKLMIGLRK